MLKFTQNKFIPLSNRYSKEWVNKYSLREHELHNLESLCEILDFRPGMKVLDIGCEKAVSAIYLAREFNIKVWAIDSKVSSSDNFKRVKEMGCEENVFPMKLDERNLPFPKEYFDLIISVNSFMKYNTDFNFSNYISNFLKPGGLIGIVEICSKTDKISVQNKNEMNTIEDNFDFVHSLDWWFNLWNSNENVKVKISEIIPENEILKNQFIHDKNRTERTEMLAHEFKNDKYNTLNIFRMVAQKINRFTGYKFYGF